MATTKKLSGPVECTGKKPCAALDMALKETESSASKRGGIGLDTYLRIGGDAHGAGGVAYRTGVRRGATTIALRFCPWCASPAYVVRAAPAPRKRAAAKTTAKEKAAPR